MYSNLISSSQMTLKRESSINLIEQNDMVLIIEPKTLFQCLSTLLFQTDIYQQQIQTLCLQQFKQHHKTLNNVSSLAEYIINQQSEQFEYLNLELISQIFKVKIELYFIDDGLLSMIINHGYVRTIRIFKEDYNYYELQTNSYRKKFKFIKKIIDQTINSFLQINNTVQYKRPLSEEGSQKLHPSLNVVLSMNDLGHIGLSVQSAKTQKIDKQYQTSTLTPQIQKIMNVNQQYSAKLPNAPITPITSQKAKKVFNFRDFQEHQVAQIIEEQEDTKFLQEIVTKTQQNPQQTQQQIIASQPERVIGYLKFYNESKQYGFFLDDKNKKDIFVHQDDFKKSCVDPECYEKKRKGLVPYFSYQVIIYQGKKQQNVKAIDIKFERYDQQK
ncbi:unnamed protein product [Paramecium pentaurelia]|uniref:CSD domain-containing protein n=1 Tax=Paramecium pentaurelia TaxID=43138 RepID=A0A8S1UQE2_9CILI|nr:unnamed protein product [Paramecium pentaurelia]